MVKGIGDLEADVMGRLWQRAGPTTVREVVDELQRERSIAYTTVMTVMDNLHRKGLLRRELDGRAYRYTPVLTREQYIAEQMAEALDTGGDRVATFVHFLQRISPEEAQALEAAYRRLTGEGKT